MWSKNKNSSKNPRVFFTPCGCHNWNLILGDAASSCVQAERMFGIIQNLYTLFSISSKRWSILIKHVNITLKPLSDTRWECRVESVKAVKYQLEEICDALNEVHDISVGDAKIRCEAESYSELISSYTFLVQVCVWYYILVKVNSISKLWQKDDMQLNQAVIHLDTFMSWIDFRNTGFESAIISANETAEKMDIPKEFTTCRCCKKKRMFSYEHEDEPLADPKELFKIKFFLVVVDMVISSMRSRFQAFKEYAGSYGFLYNILKLQNLNKEELVKKCNNLHLLLSDKNSYNIDDLELSEELDMLSRIFSTNATVTTVLKILIEKDLQDLYPNCFIVLRIILTIPVSVASAERSFSRLKLINSYLRSTMGQERLSALAVLSVENDVSNELDYSTLINEFSNQKCRKVLL
ncbi:zinc finger MYM-type protein 1-like [Hydra vulgaris]|uniref:zinc finger MYM-type protein 1-like n=1 Tax=Hydra vulgaris TaxID=6087 RepID=UPI001F5FEB90|nr:zinc finger MYM-type protein 1-like [Hydra vulgaris]